MTRHLVEETPALCANDLAAQNVAHAIRGHWGIENRDI